MGEYEFIDKALFFPKKGILVIGDLHIGYDYMLQQSGVLIPERQVKEIFEDLKKIFAEIKNKNYKLKKIVFIGDIKHSFGYEQQEKNYFRKIMKFLEDYFKEKDIIFIKGNHDTIDYSFGRMKNYYIQGDTAFTHGHELFLPVFNKKIKTIVMGHIHPSVILSDTPRIKREKYKCFLAGKYKNKEIIILPSFLATVEGTTINNLSEEYENYFSIIPKKSLLNFEIHVIGKDKIYNFGKIKNLVP